MIKTHTRPGPTARGPARREAANDDRSTITMVAMASIFGGYDMLIRSDWDGETEIEAGDDLLYTLNAVAEGSEWAEGGDHRIGRIGRDEWMLTFDRGATGKIYLQVNAIQLAELTTTIRNVRPDGRAEWWDMLASAA